MNAQMASRSVVSFRTAMLGGIVTAHGVVVYAMASGLGHSASEMIFPELQASIVPEKPQPLMQKDALPAPEMRQPRIDIPPPEIEINVPAENAITDVSLGGFTAERRMHPPKGIARPAPSYIIHARVGKHFPDPDAFYPPLSIRREEQGVVGVQVCVDQNGRLKEEPVVVTPSGYTRLDEAALKLARSGTYLAGSVDGVPIIDCLQLPIRFQMKN